MSSSYTNCCPVFPNHEPVKKFITGGVVNNKKKEINKERDLCALSVCKRGSMFVLF